MKLYDSYTNKEISITKNKINIYNCGPTVYNHIHIGNARPLIVFDVLNRFLMATKHEVLYIHNITDIDDKIINEAKKQKRNELELSSEYTIAYQEIMKRLNVVKMANPKVSENIESIIEYINKQVINNSAYVVNGNVYFDTGSISNYGALSNRKIETQKIGKRIEINHDKKNPTDFVLWKKTSDGIQWNAPWSQGRPGWHTECAVLINKYIGEQTDIHGGGIDLKFPHHENENVQNEALYNKGLARLWMHVGHVNINNEKMSKSLNNFILMKDILEDYPTNAIRWFFYQSNYRNPINYDNKAILEAKKDIEKIQLSINQTRSNLILNRLQELPLAMSQKFINILDDDLNITNGVAYIRDLIKNLNKLNRAKEYNKTNVILAELLWCLDILGIIIINNHNKETIKTLMEWDAKMKSKNYEAADLLRKKLIDLKVM